MGKMSLNQGNPPLEIEMKNDQATDGFEDSKVKRLMDEGLCKIIFHTTRNGICLLDRSGKVLEVNQAYCDMSGYSRQELRAMNISDLDGSDAPDESVQHFLYALNVGMNCFEATHYRKDDSTYEVELYVHHFSSLDDILVIIVRDISERRKVEYRLRKSEHKFKALFDESNDGIILHDLDGNIQDVNTMIQRMLGYRIEEFLTLQIPMLHPETENDAVKWALRKVMENGGVKFTTQFIRKNGSLMDAEISASVVDREKGLVQSLIRDITEQKLAHEKLEKEKNLNAVIADITQKLLSGEYEAEQAAERILAYAKALTGTHRGYISGRYSGDANQGENFPETQTYMTDKWLSVPVIIGTSVVSRISLHTTEAGFNPQDIESIERLATVYAIALRKQQFDLEKAKSDYQFFQTQKLQAINSLAGNIADHFQQVCSPLLEYAENLQNTLPADLRSQVRACEIVNGIQYAEDMSRWLLMFCRQTWQNIKPVKLQHLLPDIIEKVRAMRLPGMIEIRSYINDDCQCVMAEALQIETIIIHLISNACGAMEEIGGVLTIELRNASEMPEDSVRHPPPAGHYVHLSIKDTGSGMNDAQLENIFAPRLAVTPNRSYPGPGLHLIHSIIESYQGKIRIKSTPDQGTTVDIYFPAYGSENEERVCLADTLEMPTGTERIMLVDDEKTIVNFLMHLLKSLGYDTVVKTDLKEAIGTFQAAPDAFDLVLTDISMTHMTGNILVKELKRIRKDIPIVLCSEFTEKISISHEMATDPDIDAVIMKPVVKSELANVIRRVLDRHAC